MKLSANGLAFIKSFEGLYLTAYYCPSNVLTVGYGHTGSDVHEGLVISELEAEELLISDMRRFEAAVKETITVPLNQNEFDALVSFTFNCGANALATSTMARRLNAGEKKGLVFEQELPKWVNGADGPLPGLVRRRNEEVELATTAPVSTAEPASAFILDAVKYYNGLPHQDEAFLGLWNHLDVELQEWFIKAYRNDPIAQIPHDELDPESAPQAFPLPVPYYYQYDSATNQGGRMCFSSSMAMALDYIDPEKIDGDDDWYLGIVQYFGDTVSSEAQIKAARSLGFDAEFHMDGSEADLCRLLDAGVPVPVGILHHGFVDQPSGGGHWVCLIGYDEKYFHVHDPAGELCLVEGGYPVAGSGENQRYTRKNLMKRWLIANDQDGWYVDLTQF